MYPSIAPTIRKKLASISENELFKKERIIITPQGPTINISGGKTVINMCANNYLGLSSHPRVIAAAKAAMDERGYGLSSVRFICGTQDIHKQLEKKISDFLHKEDTILYAAAFDANGGVFEPFFGREDAIVSDALNHASIIDGIRLCKAMRYRYKHNDMEDLEAQLKQAKEDGAQHVVIATDGVFSMDGTIAQLDKICDLADTYGALVVVDDCHATGFVGATGRGTPEHLGVQDRVDIVTGTLGKALGGASGGFTSGKKDMIELLRQQSRPYLFSNTLAPAVVGGSLEVFDMLSETTDLRNKLFWNTTYFREKMLQAGFDIIRGEHPIVPIMLYDVSVTQQFANHLLEEGIYVVGFFYPVVGKGKARIRVQLSAAHEKEHLDKAVEAFAKVGKKLGVVS